VSSQVSCKMKPTFFPLKLAADSYYKAVENQSLIALFAEECVSLPDYLLFCILILIIIGFTLEVHLQNHPILALERQFLCFFFSLVLKIILIRTTALF